jgi:hypothetical protein
MIKLSVKKSGELARTIAINPSNLNFISQDTNNSGAVAFNFVGGTSFTITADFNEVLKAIKGHRYERETHFARTLNSYIGAVDRLHA